MSNASGKVGVSSITTAKLGYLTDVTSNIQAQLSNKQATRTGGITTGLTATHNINKVVITDASGKLGTHHCLSTQLDYIEHIKQ